MRKYWRLTLVLLTCLAFVLMFAYRQKYSKLSLAVQLMNAFQSQDMNTKCKKEGFDFRKNIKTDFIVQERISGIPFWTEIFPSIYSYSSYWLTKTTRTLLFTKNLSQVDLKKIQCQLHYDDEQLIIAPKTNIIFVEKKHSNNYIFVECSPFSNAAPRSISFVFKNQSSSLLPVISGNSFQGHTTICVKPLPPSFTDVYKLLEFIIFHSHTGAKLFIFYENGLSFKATKLLLEVAAKAGVRIILLPWNLPLDSRTDFNNTNLFLVDCLNRVIARNHSQLVMTLSVNDYFVPQNNWNINKIPELSAHVANVAEKRFCTEFKSDVIAENLDIPFVTLLKSKFLNEDRSIPVVYDIASLRNVFIDSKNFQTWLFKKKTRKSYFLPTTSVVIHSYRKCGKKSENELQFIEEKYMWKFKDLFFKETLYLLSKESNLIPNLTSS